MCLKYDIIMSFKKKKKGLKQTLDHMRYKLLMGTCRAGSTCVCVRVCVCV